MEYRYAFDKITIISVSDHNRVRASGWLIGADGRVPTLHFFVNGKDTEAHIVWQQREDVLQVLRNDSSFRWEQNLDVRCGFTLTAEDIPGELQNISFAAEDGFLLRQLDKKEIEETARKHLIVGKIDTLTYDKNNHLYSLFGWAYSADGKPVELEIEDNKGRALLFHSKAEKRLDVVKAMPEIKNMNCGFHIWFTEKPHLKFSLVMRTDEDRLLLPCHLTLLHDQQLAVKNRMKAIHQFFHDENGREVIRKKGLDYGLRRISYLYDSGRYYDRWLKEHRVSNKELLCQRRERFPIMPRISLVVPVYNTTVPYLDQMIDTVRTQSYGNWELCIADGSDENHPARKELEKYQADDPRIRVIRLPKNYGISGNTNKALEMVTGEYTAFYDHDDFLEPDALYEAVKMINEEHCDMLYTDEDKYLTDKKAFFMPAFKPDFNIDLLRSDNYICHLTIVRTDLLKQVGGFRSEFDGSQDYDLILRCAEKAEHISHIPRILYHWRMYENSTAFDPASKMYCYEAGQCALQEHLQRMRIKGKVSMLEPPYYGYYRVEYEVHDDPLVSIIILNRDQKETLEKCIKSIFEINTYHNIEVIIAENNSTDENIRSYYEKIQTAHSNVHVIDCSGKSFNYASLNNQAVKYAHGRYLLFLNNDTAVIEPESIRLMTGMAERDDVGIVGAKLLYGNDTVQHAGVVLSHTLTAVHPFSGLDSRDTSYMVRMQVNTDYSAVTGACLMISRGLFDEIGGFDEKLAIAYNDVDLCLKVRQKKKLVVYNAFSIWHHYESVSRGYDISEEKKSRLMDEGNYLRTKWKNVYAGTDPYYNPNFDDEKPFALKLC